MQELPHPEKVLHYDWRLLQRPSFFRLYWQTTITFLFEKGDAALLQNKNLLVIWIRHQLIAEICHFFGMIIVCTDVLRKGVAKYDKSTIFIVFFCEFIDTPPYRNVYPEKPYNSSNPSNSRLIKALKNQSDLNMHGSEL